MKFLFAFLTLNVFSSTFGFIENGEESTEFDPEVRSVAESNCAVDGGISYGCGASRKNPFGKDNCCPGLVCHGRYSWRCVKEENKFCAGPTTFSKQCGSRWRLAVAHCCDGLVCGDKEYERRCVKPTTDTPTDAPSDAPTDEPTAPPNPMYKISVFVRNADLCDVDFGWGDSDPYGRLELTVGGRKDVIETKVVNNDDSPTFNQWIRFPKSYERVSKHEKFTFKIHMFDDSSKGPNHDENLGYKTFSFHLNAQHTQRHNVVLDNAPCWGDSKVSFDLLVQEV